MLDCSQVGHLFPHIPNVFIWENNQIGTLWKFGANPPVPHTHHKIIIDTNNTSNLRRQLGENLDEGSVARYKRRKSCEALAVFAIVLVGVHPVLI